MSVPHSSAWSRSRRLAAHRCCLPLDQRRRLPQCINFGAQSHGLFARCRRFAAFLPGCPVVRTRKTRFRLVVSLCRTGSRPLGSLVKFLLHLHRFLLTQALPGALYALSPHVIHHRASAPRRQNASPQLTGAALAGAGSPRAGAGDKTRLATLCGARQRADANDAKACATPRLWRRGQIVDQLLGIDRADAAREVIALPRSAGSAARAAHDVMKCRAVASIR